jgi:imidazolonepropionase-like amidohydrolase
MALAATLAATCVLALGACSPASEEIRPTAPRTHATPQPKVPSSVRCAVIWDPDRGAIADGRVTFEKGRVSALGPASAVPAAGPELDLRPLFCMPGLVDAHTHLTSYAQERPTDGMDRRRAEAARNAEATLRAGITSVRDLGGAEGVDLWLRARINAGAVAGPRMQCAGSQIGAEGPVGGAAAAKNAVDAHLDAGFDVIKLFASGDPRDAVPLLTAPEVAAATAEAHARGAKVAVHAVTEGAIEAAIAAHVDSIEHGQALTEEQARAMAAEGIALVPTFYILRYYVTDAEQLGLTAEHVADMRNVIDTVVVPFEKRFPAILATGVQVAMGSDAFLGLHGRNAHELAYLMQNGMKPEQALRAATEASAKLMGWSGKVGTLVPGAFGDLVALPDDPRVDMGSTEHAVVVIKGGSVVRDDRR